MAQSHSENPPEQPTSRRQVVAKDKTGEVPRGRKVGHVISLSRFPTSRY
jgi:hypothetical protein